MKKDKNVFYCFIWCDRITYGGASRKSQCSVPANSNAEAESEVQ